MYKYKEAKLYIITELLKLTKIHLHITLYNDIVKSINITLYNDMQKLNKNWRITKKLYSYKIISDRDE